MQVKIEGTRLAEVRIGEPDVHSDPRGFFVEVYNSSRFDPGRPFVQINHSRSRGGAVRGMHFQEPKAQGKLIWVTAGVVFDVAVDVRRGSPSFGRWMGVELSESNHRHVWVPPGFAHGFCVLSESADFLYACTEHYDRASERVVRWDDPAIGIRWPVSSPTLSDRDRAAPLLADAPVLPDYRAST